VIHEVFEGDEPLLILSIPDEARNEQQPTQSPRMVVQTRAPAQKMISKPPTVAGKKATVAVTPAAPGTTSTRAANPNPIPETSGALEYAPMNAGSPPFNPEFSAESPYISELLSINSMDSASSTPESPGVQVEAVKSPEVVSVSTTDMVPVDEQVNR